MWRISLMQCYCIIIIIKDLIFNWKNSLIHSPPPFYVLQQINAKYLLFILFKYSFWPKLDFLPNCICCLYFEMIKFPIYNYSNNNTLFRYFFPTLKYSAKQLCFLFKLGLNFILNNICKFFNYYKLQIDQYNLPNFCLNVTKKGRLI